MYNSFLSLNYMVFKFNGVLQTAPGLLTSRPYDNLSISHFGMKKKQTMELLEILSTNIVTWEFSWDHSVLNMYIWNMYLYNNLNQVYLVCFTVEFYVYGKA